MINNDQSTLLLYCCKDVKSHRSGGDTVLLNTLTGKSFIVICHKIPLSSMINNPLKIKNVQVFIPF